MIKVNKELVANVLKIGVSTGDYDRKPLLIGLDNKLLKFCVHVLIS